MMRPRNEREMILSQIYLTMKVIQRSSRVPSGPKPTLRAQLTNQPKNLVFKQSKVAALLAKRKAIQEQKAALEKQMGEVATTRKRGA